MKGEMMVEDYYEKDGIREMVVNEIDEIRECEDEKIIIWEGRKRLIDNVEECRKEEREEEDLDEVGCEKVI